MSCTLSNKMIGLLVDQLQGLTWTQIKHFLFKQGLNDEFIGSNKLAALGHVFYRFAGEESPGGADLVVNTIQVVMDDLRGQIESREAASPSREKDSAENTYHMFELALVEGGFTIVGGQIHCGSERAGGGIDTTTEESLAVPAQDSRPSSERMRHHILSYLEDWLRKGDSEMPGLSDLVGALQVDEEQIREQLDVLETLGAVIANWTFTSAAPQITEQGRVLLENLDQVAQPVDPVPGVATGATVSRAFEWDAFISHASEDKDPFVRDLASRLQNEGLKIWYDESELEVGDSLNRSIDHGLANSRYAIVILSPYFFSKEWARRELDALAARDLDGRKVILPVWFNISREEILEVSPILADRVAAKASAGIDAVVADLLKVLRQPAVIERRAAISAEVAQAHESLPHDLSQFRTQRGDLV